MLVLTATNELQGTSPGDYSFSVEDQLVTPLAAEWCLGRQQNVTTSKGLSHPTAICPLVDKPSLPIKVEPSPADQLGRDHLDTIRDPVRAHLRWGLATVIDHPIERVCHSHALSVAHV
jgi:hypothetical protein